MREGPYTNRWKMNFDNPLDLNRHPVYNFSHCQYRFRHSHKRSLGHA